MKRFLTARYAAMLVAVMMVLGSACTVRAYTVAQNWARVGGTAGEALTTGDVVAIKAADGLVYKADADEATLRPAVGIVGLGGASGGRVEIIVQGRVSGFSDLTKGAMAYLSGTAGALTQSAPAWAQPVGVALSATELYVNFSNYVDATGLTGLVPSTLAANAPDVAGAVWGASNGLVFEGATANAHETTVTVVDPTADRTITLPDASGTPTLTGTNGAATHDYAGAAADWELTVLEAEAGFISASNANGAVNAIFASCRAGKDYYVLNGTGQTLTVKVTGESGGTIATGKMALYVCNGTDVVELYEQP